MPPLRRHRPGGQVRAALAAGRRRVPEPLIGSSTRRIVVPGSPGCLPGRRFPRSRSDRSRLFLYGLSDEGGRDDVDESRRPRRSSSSTRADKRSTCAA
jgi:hypothetical protein